MIFLDDIQNTVNEAYVALAGLQYSVSIREPVSGDIKTFNKAYTLSTKIIAYLEYLNSLNLNVSFVENSRIEDAVFSLKEIISKTKILWL